MLNPLHKFASYTYQASVYLMTATQYRNLLNSGNKTIPDSQLLFQSGGKTVGNKFFDNDFYIDNITVETQFAGKQRNLAFKTGSGLSLAIIFCCLPKGILLAASSVFFEVI